MIFDKLAGKIGNKYAALILIFSAVLLAVLIIAGATLIPTVFTKIDLTANEMYTLSDETLDLIKSVDEEVTIYLVADPGEVNEGIKTFLERYAGKSKHITLKMLDPTLDAEELFKYSGDTPPANSIVVKTDARYKMIPYYDLFYYGEDAYEYAYQTYTQYVNAGLISSSSLSFNDYLKSIAVYEGCYSGYEYEESVNAAIRYVTSDSLKKIYLLAGHEEDSPSFDVYNTITNYGIELNRINADKIDIPADTDLLLLFPNSDITSAERERLSAYMKNGGKIFMVTTQGVDCRTLYELVKEYGVETDGKYLCEDNVNYNYGEMPAYTLPDITDDGLAVLLEERAASVLLAGTHGITLTETPVAGVTVTPLFTTSPECYTTGDTVNYKYADGVDVRKTRYTGVKALNENGGGIVWISSPTILFEEYTVYTNGGNLLTLTYYINLLTENECPEPIPAVMLASGSVNVPKWFTYTFATVFCGIVPLTLVGYAVVRKKLKDEE